MKTFSRKNVLGWALVAIVSCTALGDALAREGAGRPPRAPNPGEIALPFRKLEVSAFGRRRGEHRTLLTSPRMYQTFVGSPPPEGLDFQREWVFLYAPGTMPTGGYEADISYIGRSTDGRTLTIETRLFEPGHHCFVTQALTNPYVLVSFPRPEAVQRVVFTHVTEVRDCPSEPTLSSPDVEAEPE
ncbi:protease complex subunit PrcB family protein [Polyangium jinanense]|uniref:Protease complex subunit PrcB family protein n=1 Tax=Polyangium jinanense TaxID=2829994 RepID=A0A9X3WYZ9_9BACT|nr:protease complex subunit PrcB family protein [Polyangium jinanense]MDC3954664.1 protease complex subunit PrcB family protein [Polyangium jinanense]MDC3980967.1 protease complex subunit PrcB family protein [Polyangium jinanense]